MEKLTDKQIIKGLKKDVQRLKEELNKVYDLSSQESLSFKHWIKTTIESLDIKTDYLDSDKDKLNKIANKAITLNYEKKFNADMDSLVSRNDYQRSRDLMHIIELIVTGELDTREFTSGVDNNNKFLNC